VADLEPDGDGGVTLAYEGKRVSFPAQAVEAVTFCAEAEGQFTPGDFPGDLDEPSCLVVVRRLVREGFLRLTAADPDGRAPRSAADGPA
ncbi:MAG TPA: hypothetical protein VHK22_09345, partial [Gaiellaceae bacterium]|nr:hypothetical protein [Gaiellaceae bacterium]